MKRQTRRDLLATGGSLLSLGLAGCSTFRSPTLPSGEYPQGTSKSGIEDYEQLLSSTHRALRNNAYDITIKNHPITAQYQSSLSEKRQVRTITGPSQLIELFFEDGVAYVKIGPDGESKYGKWTYDRPFDRIHGSSSRMTVDILGGSLTTTNAIAQLDGPQSLDSILNVGNFQPAKATELNGLPVLKFALQSVDQKKIDGDVSKTDGSLFIDSQGVVHEASLRIETTSNGTTNIEVLNSVRINSLSVSGIPEPSWIKEQFQSYS